MQRKTFRPEIWLTTCTHTSLTNALQKKPLSPISIYYLMRTFMLLYIKKLQNSKLLFYLSFCSNVSQLKPIILQGSSGDLNSIKILSSI